MDELGKILLKVQLSSAVTTEEKFLLLCLEKHSPFFTPSLNISLKDPKWICSKFDDADDKKQMSKSGLEDDWILAYFKPFKGMPQYITVEKVI